MLPSRRGVTVSGRRAPGRDHSMIGRACLVFPHPARQSIAPTPCALPSPRRKHRHSRTHRHSRAAPRRQRLKHAPHRKHASRCAARTTRSATRAASTRAARSASTITAPQVRAARAALHLRAASTRRKHAPHSAACCMSCKNAPHEPHRGHAAPQACVHREGGGEVRLGESAQGGGGGLAPPSLFESISCSAEIIETRAARRKYREHVPHAPQARAICTWFLSRLNQDEIESRLR
jgi:hypothetical protein